MSTEVTVEQNKVIAEFMGLKVIPAGTKALCDFLQGEVSAAFLKYHEDWNQLFCVCRKIKELVKADIDERSKDVPPGVTWTTDMSNRFYPIEVYAGRFDIEKTHKAVYDFIQWYQQSIKTPLNK